MEVKLAPAARVVISAQRQHVLKTLGLFALVTSVFVYGFHTFLRVQSDSDLTLHIGYAREIHSVGDLGAPQLAAHFLFQLLLKAFSFLFGVDYFAGTAWLLGLCYGGMAVLIAYEIERRGAALTAFRAFVVVPALLLASHIFLPTILMPNLYYGYFVPITYHSPTQQLNKLFALWIYFLYCAQFIDVRRAAPTRVAGMTVLSILSALAKPSFLVAFIPAAGLYSLRDMARRHWRQASLFLAGVALPVSLLMLWQAREVFGADASRLVFAPFVVFKFIPTLYKLPASMAFPLIVLAAAWRRGAVDDRLRFVWLFNGIAFAMTLMLGEGGTRLFDGNFAWTGQTAVFLSYVESVLFLLTTSVSVGWRRTAWAVSAAHVACGLIWYAVMFWPQRPEWL